MHNCTVLWPIIIYLHHIPSILSPFILNSTLSEMTVSRGMVSSSMLPTSSFLTNGAQTSSSNPQNQDDPINKYARHVISRLPQLASLLVSRLWVLTLCVYFRILFEHTQRQMDSATHSIRNGPNEQQSVPRDSHTHNHTHSHGQTSVAWWAIALYS